MGGYPSCDEYRGGGGSGMEWGVSWSYAGSEVAEVISEAQTAGKASAL